LEDRVFDNYWFQTGTPTFLVKLLKEHQEFVFEEVSVSSNLLDNFDVANPLSVPLLFQTGYLTIREYFGCSV
jgi:hypothetical protein